MKKYTNLFILSLLVIFVAVSCADQPKTISLDENHNTRAGQAETMQVTFEGKSITIEAADVINITQNMNAENADAEAVMNIQENFQGAEKEAQLLDVEFTMSDEPVENGMFIFGIETQDSKELTMEMFDEEGFAMVANNKFEVTEGNNYKALNVHTLDNGTYTFRLKDDAGKELNRQVTVAAEK